MNRKSCHDFAYSVTWIIDNSHEKPLKSSIFIIHIDGAALKVTQFSKFHKYSK